MHRDVKERIEKSRIDSRKYHNSKTNIKPINFTVGDFVLVSSHVKEISTHKLASRWVGPRRIVSCDSEMVYTIENIITKEREKVHSRRMLLYRADMQDEIVDPKLMKQAEFSEASVQILKHIHAIRKKNNEYEVQFEWEGLPQTNDWSWEPIDSIREDVPGVLEDFLHTAGNRLIKRKVLATFY